LQNISGTGILVWKKFRTWNRCQISNLRNISGIGILVYRVLQILEFAKYVWNRNFSLSDFTDFGFWSFTDFGICKIYLVQEF
jgi:hypothetical protein